MLRKIVIMGIFAVMFLQTHTEPYTIKVLVSSQMQPLLPFVAEQRIVMFKEYPYLYEGNRIEEDTYLAWFAALPHSALAVAYHGDQPVGFLTGTSFAAFDDHFQGSAELFKNAGLKLHEYYYFPECIILSEHRGHRLSEKLCAALETFAYDAGYTVGCMVTESHDNHPLKPHNYTSMNHYWKQLGYTQSSLAIAFSWPTLQPDGSTKNQEHSLIYWFKKMHQ